MNVGLVASHWAEIEADRFEWYWQRREDGNDWQVVWHISYARLPLP